MYHSIVARLARTNFDRVNRKRYDAVLAGCASNIRHRFAGAHALGGTRHDRDGLQRWFGRLGRVMPSLHLDVQQVWVTGWPWHTTIIMRWEETATLADGSPYRNRGVHVIAMRWGSVIDIDVHADSQNVAAGLRVQAAHGMAEAAALPILS